MSLNHRAGTDALSRSHGYFAEIERDTLAAGLPSESLDRDDHRRTIVKPAAFCAERSPALSIAIARRR
jgi:hypothetical protein